jgi:hypothetical protein
MGRSRAVEVTVGEFTLARVADGIEISRTVGEFEQTWLARNWSAAMDIVQECEETEAFAEGKPVRWQS